jgi:hypothetical protein
MKRDVAAQLLALRRRHEQRAFETLARCEAALKNARRAVSEAQDETRHYEAEARVQERELIAQITGKPAASDEIARLRTIRDNMSFTAKKLRAAEARASSNAQQAQQDVADARQEVMERQKAVLKLETFVKKYRHRIERQRAELAEEELLSQGKARQSRGTSR